MDQDKQQKGWVPSMKDSQALINMKEDPTPWERLANSIIEQAAHDYRKLGEMLQTSNGEERAIINRKMVGISGFFLSKWFACLTTADGAEILEMLDKEVFGDERA